MDYLEIIGALVGLLYLYLEYRASIYLWMAGIVMPSIYIYVFYGAGLYADMGISVYYLLAALYGWIMWMKGRGAKKERRITHTPLRCVLPLCIVFTGLFAGIAYLLLRFTDSTVAYEDAFINALSIIAMWMLAYKYLEQWLVWIVVDIACCALYAYKGLYLTTVLYGLYTIIALFGYLKWKRMMLNTKGNEALSAVDR